MTKDNVMVWGGGGREHALTWKLAKSEHVEKVYVTQPSPGILEIEKAEPAPVTTLEDGIKFAEENNVALTVVGPEVPLVNGIVDKFEAAGLRAFGPSQKAAQLEGSKIFTKDLLRDLGVPTADYETFDNANQALDYVKWRGAPLVVKADGLAAGKGAIVCQTLVEAEAAISTIMVEKAFKDAGNEIVIEDFMDGEEASILAFVDGYNIKVLVATQDHKPAYDNDEGPNTGGMGAYGPAPVVTDAVLMKAMNKILVPTVEGMAERGTPFKGCLYLGAMIDKKGNPSVVEYNIRFGDPEAQPIVMLTETDFYPLMQASIDGTLSDFEIATSKGAACCVVMASDGYPGSYEKGKVITGLDSIVDPDTYVFHAGTKMDENNIVTNGGRVLGVTALGSNFQGAIDRAYAAVKKIEFEGGAMLRTDIGQKALNR